MCRDEENNDEKKENGCSGLCNGQIRLQCLKSEPKIFWRIVLLNFSRVSFSSLPPERPRPAGWEWKTNSGRHRGENQLFTSLIWFLRRKEYSLFQHFSDPFPFLGNFKLLITVVQFSEFSSLQLTNISIVISERLQKESQGISSVYICKIVVQRSSATALWPA